MPDYTLIAPDGTEHVTGDGSDRARLLGLGYRDTETSRTVKAAPKPSPRADTEPRPPKPEINNDSK
jgi:hypothetical protein